MCMFSGFAVVYMHNCAVGVYGIVVGFYYHFFDVPFFLIISALSTARIIVDETSSFIIGLCAMPSIALPATAACICPHFVSL